MSPWFVIISGLNIRIGHSFTAIGEMPSSADWRVGRNFGEGRVEIGDACLMSPGQGSLRATKLCSATVHDGSW